MNNLVKDENKQKEAAVESTRGKLYDSPACNLYETDENYKILFDLPGIERDNISIKIDKDILYMNAECVNEPGPEYICIRNETDFTGYKRSFNLNGRVDPDKVDAEFIDGVLSLTLAKKEEQKTKEIKVKVS